MYTLDVVERNMKVKAKRLRKDGFVPCSLDSIEKDKTLLFTITSKEANELLKTKAKGSVISIRCNGEDHKALIKSVSKGNVNSGIEDITFQKLYDDVVVKSVSKVILLNKENIPTKVQLVLPEIPYKALPKNIIESVEIDLEQFRAGDQVKVKDLSISNATDVELMIDSDNVVLNMVAERS